MLKVEQLLNVVSFDLEESLVAFVGNLQKSVFMLLDLLLKIHIVVSGVHQSQSEVSWENDLDDTDLFDDNTVRRKLLLKTLLNLSSHL